MSQELERELAQQQTDQVLRILIAAVDAVGTQPVRALLDSMRQADEIGCFVDPTDWIRNSADRTAIIALLEAAHTFSVKGGSAVQLMREVAERNGARAALEAQR